MNEELKKYYEYLKSIKADIPDTFESFELTLSDENNAKSYFNYLKTNKFDTPDTFESFSETFGLKKKVSPLTNLGQDTGIISEESQKLQEPYLIPPQPSEPTKTSNVPPTSELILQPPKLGWHQDIPNYLERGKDIPRPQETAKTVGEWITAAAGVFDKKLSDMFNSLDYIQTSAEDAVTQILLGKETANGVKQLRDDGFLIRPTGVSPRPFEAIADAIDYMASGAKPLPKTIGGAIVSGTMGVIPDILAATLAPEVKTAKILQDMGIKVASKFGMVIGAEEAIAGARGAEEQGVLKKIEAPFVGALEGYMTGWMFDNLGAMSSKIGGKIANKLVPEVKTISQAVDKALVEHTATSLTNATFFGTYGNMEEYIRTGKISVETFATNAGMGLALGLRETGKLLYAKGINAFIAAPKEVIARTLESDISSEELAKQAKEKADLVESGKSTNREEDLASAMFVGRMSELKAFTDEVKNNKDEVLQSIKESTLDTKVKDLVIDKINEIEADKDTKIQGARAFTAQLSDINDKIGAIRENKNLSDVEKELRSEELKTKREELRNKIIEVYNNPPKLITPVLTLGGENFKTKKDLFAYLEKVAINDKGELDKAWFDREIESWPNEATIKAINEWTENKKVELRTKIEEETKNAAERRTGDQAISKEGGIEVGVGQVEGLLVRDVSLDKETQGGETREVIGSGEEVKSPQEPLITDTKVEKPLAGEEVRGRSDALDNAVKARNSIGDTNPQYFYPNVGESRYQTWKEFKKANKKIAEASLKEHWKEITGAYPIDAPQELIDKMIVLHDEVLRVEKNEVPASSQTEPEQAQGLVEGTEGGLHLGYSEENRVEAEQREEIKPKEKPKSRTATVLSETPQSFEESLLQFFLRGGRIKTDDFVRYTGYKRGSPEFKSYIWAIKNEGTSLDVLNESMETFGMEGKGAMDMINSAVDLLIKYPGRGSMLERLEKYQSERSGQVIPESMKTEESDLADMEFDIKTDVQETRYFDEEYEALDDIWKEYFKDGTIRWEDIARQLKENEKFFTSFPFDLNKNELSLLNKILDNEGERKRIEFLSQGISGIYGKSEGEDAIRGDEGIQRESETKGKPQVTPKEAISAPIIEKGAEIPPEPPKPVETPEKGQEQRGIAFKDKIYTDIEQVQDDFANGKLTITEQRPLLEKVRKFEDGLKTIAKNKSTEIDKNLSIVTEKSAKKLGNLKKKSIDELTKLSVKFFPIDISKTNTALWKLLIKPRDAISDWIANKMQLGIQSQTDAIRWVSTAVKNMYGGLARTQAEMFGKKGLGGIGKLEMIGTVREYAPYQATQLQDKLRTIVNSDYESLRRVRDVLDPEIAKEQLTYDDLTPSEQNLHDALKELNTWVHETNYADDFIPTETYLKFKDENGNVKYIARLYDEFELGESEMSEFIKPGSPYKLETDIFKMRKEVDDYKKEHAMEDPIYLTTKRVMQTIQNHAIKEYQNLILQSHPDFVKEVKVGEKVPKGFTKLSSSRAWGQLRNKAVANHIVEDFKGYFYANHILNTLYDGLKMFDKTKVNQFYKKWHTVYNPFVQLGNFTGNLFFGSIAGVNPVVLMSKMPEATRDAKAGTDEYKSLLKAGLFGSTGITGDMTPLTAQNKQRIKNVNAFTEALDSAREILSKADEATTKLYQATDNIAKYAAYKIFRDQGLTHEQSVRRVYDSFQNYANVGKTWDVASKTPFLGNKFVKFQADLQRILLNAMTTSPLTTVGTLMIISALGTVASKLSGEDEEEKKVRETRKGVAKIPLPFGQYVPLSFKIGKKEVNFARFLSPLFLYRQGDSDADLAEISKFLPFQVQRVDKSQLGERGYAPAWSDPTLGWIPQVIADRDFRSVSIQNPRATKYFNPNPTADERIANVINYVARAQLPFYKSMEDIMDGVTGRLDYYGRKRTWPDAILNNIIKIQAFDKPELKNYIEGNISYLTNRFAALSEAMGNTNSAFLKEIQRAKDEKLPDYAIERTYKEQDRIREKRLQKSLDQQIPVLEELERLTRVYRGWYPNDPFVQDNYLSIQAGESRRFAVLDDIDLQKKYKDEYLLLKNNRLLKRPEIPNYYNGKELTDEQKKVYTSIYWSEYVRNMDAFIGLTQEEFDVQKKIITDIKESKMTPEPIKTTRLQERANTASQRAKKVADIRLIYEMTKK